MESFICDYRGYDQKLEEKNNESLNLHHPNHKEYEDSNHHNHKTSHDKLEDSNVVTNVQSKVDLIS